MRKKWLVTITGYYEYHAPPNITISTIIELEEGLTPIDWFQTNPTVYNRFSIVVTALIKFWPVKENIQKIVYINTTKKRRRER